MQVSREWLLGDASLDERAQRGVGGGGALRELERVARRDHREHQPHAPVQRRYRQRGRAVPACDTNTIHVF